MCGLLSGGHLGGSQRQAVSGGEGHALGIKRRCPFSGMGSGEQTGVLWLPGGGEGATGGAKRPAPLSSLPQSLSLRHLFFLLTLSPCSAPSLMLAGGTLRSPETPGLPPCPLPHASTSAVEWLASAAVTVAA